MDPGEPPKNCGVYSVITSKYEFSNSLNFVYLDGSTLTVSSIPNCEGDDVF